MNRRLAGAAAIAWAAALLGILGHRWGSSRTTLDMYKAAGEHWLHGEALYFNWRGFVYSPLIAAFFAPFNWIPARLGTFLWLGVNAAALLGGLAAMLRAGLVPKLSARHFGIPFLLLLPLAIGNLDVMQCNALMIGLIMLAFAAAPPERWMWAATAIGAATALKIYPLAAGLLLVLLAPWRFGWRLGLALAAFALAPYLFQHWSYVSEQYHAWIATRTADNRLNYAEQDRPTDLYLLLHWVAGLPIPPLLYRAIQVLAGGAIAGFEVLAWWKGWPRRRILTGSFCFVSIWMTLLGPATEPYTYLVLAPAVVLAATEAWATLRPAWSRALVTLVFVMLLFAVARSSLAPHFRPVWTETVQPLAAVLFFFYCLYWLGSSEAWEPCSEA